jgi:glycosyltransferase involved in cell wall biosynthesis
LIDPGLRLLLAWVRLWRRARKIDPPDFVLIGYLGLLDVHLARWLWRDRQLVLDQLTFAADTARDRRVGGSGMRRLLAWLDRRAVNSADLVLIDTEENLSLLPRSVRDRGLVVPVGAQGNWFRAPVKRPKRPLRVVFFGLYTPLQGAPTIGAAARLLIDADVEFTLIGTGQELEATRYVAREARSVTWLDWIDPADLPGLVADHDVCLGIFGGSDKARRVVPNKVYEGAAAGCAIITSDTPPQRRALGEDALYVPARDSKTLAATLRSLAEDRRRLWRYRQAGYRRAVADFRPEVVVAPLARALTALSERPGPRRPAGRSGA